LQRRQALSPVQSPVSLNKGARYGRVLDVVLDDTHPLWQELGCSQAQYGVLYQKLYEDGQEDGDNTSYSFAYCYNPTFRRVPVRNEIVSLASYFSADKSNEIASSTGEKIYWTGIIPLWNLPFLNEYPAENPPSFGDFFDDNPQNTNPLQLCPGDVSIEGRHGQSIRFGGTWYNSSQVATQETNGKPYTIIRNGQGTSESQGDKAVYEDINADRASIYLTSDHKIDLKQANDKRDAWKSGPEKASDYKGAQILFNAGRIFINSKEDDIQLSAKTSAGINAGDCVGIDAKNYVGVDAKKIYLGKKALNEREPILLGDTSVSWLDELCNILNTYFSSTTGVTSPGTAGLVGGASTTAMGRLASLKAKIRTLQSKKVYVE
jgi:hypothetical protein